MVGHTRSSNGRRASNGRARASLLLGLLAAAALPVAIAVAETTDLIELLEAAGAIPVAAIGGIAAIALGRRARVRFERTLGRVGGAGAARLGRLLGSLALALAAAGTIAVAFYYFLADYSK